MKHIKHLFVVCLLLLVATTATAQTQSDNTQTKAVSATKADVNGDGVVNEADIAEIIAIIKENNDVKYYWYVGNTTPEGMTPPSVGNANTSLCAWTYIGTSLPTTSIKVYKEDGNYDDHKWYVAAPTAAGFTIYNYQDALPDGGIVYVKSFMIGNVSYDLWSNVNPAYNMAITLHK